MLILMALVAGCGVNRAQVRLCEQVARVMEDESASVDVLQALRHPRLDDAVILDYRVTAASGEVASRWISCRFAGGSLAPAPRALVGVTTSREGTLAPIRIALLQIWLRLADRGPRSAGEQPTPLGPPAGHPVYLAQQLVNAIPLSSVYALIAIGFSLVYGVIGRINLALGEFATLAGYTMFLGISLLVVISADKVVGAIAAVLLLAALVSGVYGWVTQRVMFRPLRLSTAGQSGPGIGQAGGADRHPWPRHLPARGDAACRRLTRPLAGARLHLVAHACPQRRLCRDDQLRAIDHPYRRSHYRRRPRLVDDK